MYLSEEKARELIKALKKLDYAQPTVLSWLSRKNNLSFRTQSMLDLRIRQGEFREEWANSLIEMVSKSDSKTAQTLKKKFL